MGRTKIVKMRFDLSNEYQAATYQRLAESARRADRRGRGNQAYNLVALILGTIPYRGLRWTGLTERPQFPPELDELAEQLDNLDARICEITGRIDRLLPKQNHHPVLRLVPTSDQDNPKQSA